MHRIDSTGAAAALPAPSAVGATVGYFTAGNPGGGVPATIVSADWLNAVQEELASVVEGAGLALDKTNRGQLLAALLAVAARNGQCQLSVQDATHLLLKPFNGNRVLINGRSCSIPDAGLTVTNAALAAGTVYNVYVADTNADGVADALEVSATAHASQAGTGLEVKNGDATRTFVGKIRTTAATQFADSATQRFCDSYFNPVPLALQGAGTSNATTASTTAVELNTAARAEFVCGPGRVLDAALAGDASNNTAGGQAAVNIGLDGVAIGIGSTNVFTAANARQALSGKYSAPIAEGYHYVTPLGNTASAATTGTFNVGVAGIVR